MFAIPKKIPGSVRLVVDYCRLNTVTVTDHYYLPRIEDTLERMARASTFDLTHGFYQVSLKMDDRDRTTFLTPFGKFGLVAMPSGLRNAHATFQYLMDSILGVLSDFTNIYMVDTSVFSVTWRPHPTSPPRV